MQVNNNEAAGSGYRAAKNLKENQPASTREASDTNEDAQQFECIFEPGKFYQSGSIGTNITDYLKANHDALISLATTSKGDFNSKAEAGAKILSQDNFKATSTDDGSLLIKHTNDNSLSGRTTEESYLIKKPLITLTELQKHDWCGIPNKTAPDSWNGPIFKGFNRSELFEKLTYIMQNNPEAGITSVQLGEDIPGTTDPENTIIINGVTYTKTSPGFREQDGYSFKAKDEDINKCGIETDLLAELTNLLQNNDHLANERQSQMLQILSENNEALIESNDETTFDSMPEFFNNS